MNHLDRTVRVKAITERMGTLYTFNPANHVKKKTAEELKADKDLHANRVLK